ncbi:MAG TPA: TlpA disulfide reductase family protein [Pirellulales bacterium]|nr:TlpA disulfide reductase family protein [Pirellulales bacterium]
MTDATKRGTGFWVTLAVLAAAVVVYVSLVTRPSPGPAGVKNPAVGLKLIDLHLTALTGNSQDVSLDDLRGHVTLLNFWGTWCPPCVREFPEIVELHEKFAAAEDFRLYAVSCGQGDENLAQLRAETEDFLQSRATSMPTYADPNSETQRALVHLLSATDMFYPTTLVLDRSGTIRGFWQGYHPAAVREMRQLVAQLLDEQPARKAP